MNPFRKRSSLVTEPSNGSARINEVVLPTSKVVSTKDNPEPTTYVEMKVHDVRDYAQRLGLPHDEDYQLRDMIAAGRIPEEVPVSGLLNSNDPTDIQNVGRGDAMFDRLQDAVEGASKSVSGAAPTTTPEPTN